MRLAVSKAIGGGEYAILGFSMDLFKEPELLQLLSSNRSDATDDRTQGFAKAIGNARIRFDERASDAIALPVQNDVSKFGHRIQMLKYTRLLGELLDQHLSEGDLIFFVWHPRNSDICKHKWCQSHEGADYFCCSNSDGPHGPEKAGLVRLGALARARGATLVLTTGVYKPDTHTIELAAFQEAVQYHETLLREVAAKEDSVLHWTFGHHFCEASLCSNSISGTNQNVN